MKNIINKLLLPLWYLLTFFCTVALFTLHMLWQDAGEYSISFPQLAPLLSTVLLVAVTKNREACAGIRAGLGFCTGSISWCLIAVALPFVLVGASICLLSFFSVIQIKPWAGSLPFYILNFLAMLAGSFSEEIGWRGYLLPQLKKKFSPLWSSVIVGVLWGFWHLNYAGDITMWLLFVATTVELSLMMTFLLHKSKGCLWTSVLFHAFLNLTNRILVLNLFGQAFLLAEIGIFGILCAIMLIADKDKMLRKPLQ